MSIELTTKQRSKIKRAVKALNDARKEIELDNAGSDINWFLEDCGNLNLMNGNTHDLGNNNGSANYGNVIEVFDLDNAGGGGW